MLEIVRHEFRTWREIPRSQKFAIESESVTTPLKQVREAPGTCTYFRHRSAGKETVGEVREVGKESRTSFIDQEVLVFVGATSCEGWWDVFEGLKGKFYSSRRICQGRGRRHAGEDTRRKKAGQMKSSKVQRNSQIPPLCRYWLSRMGSCRSKKHLKMTLTVEDIYLSICRFYCPYLLFYV